MACGRNDGGELGDGTTFSPTTPMTINGLNNIIAVENRNSPTMFIKIDRSV